MTMAIGHACAKILSITGGIMSTRIRTVKPELYRHLGLYEAEKYYQLPLRTAFAGLFNSCDREGRFRWQPHSLKLDVLPYDELDFSTVLDALHCTGFIKKYQVDGKLYGCIPTWKKHQAINLREAQSTLPPPPDQDEPFEVHSESVMILPIRVSTEKPAPKSHDTCMHVHAHGEGNWKGREKEEEREEEIKIYTSSSPMQDDDFFPPLSSSDEDDVYSTNENPEQAKPEVNDTGTSKIPLSQAIDRIFRYWQEKLEHPKAKLDEKRRRYLAKALKMGYSVDDLCKVVRGCVATPFNMGENASGERYDDITLLFRSNSHIERFIHNADHPPKAMFVRSASWKNRDDEDPTIGAR